MSLSITISNQIKCYNLSICPTLPQFLEEAYKTHKSLKNNELYKKRIEVIQDFDFPTACTQVEETPDQNYIIASGLYAPSLKIYETSQLSLKCMRGLDSEIVKFCVLQNDYKKVALALSDRNIELHAQYGQHYKTRVPKMPTDMIYNQFTCDLIVSSSSDQLVRLSLDQGKFMQSIVCPNESGVNTLDINEQLNVLYAGGNDFMSAIDYRQRQLAIQVPQDRRISAIKSNKLNVAVGYEDGQVRVFDVRQNRPLLNLQHQYKLPIKKLQFIEKYNMLVSADQKIIKYFQMNQGGSLFTSVEPQCELNSFSHIKDSGIFLVAHEQPRIGIYFIPQLDPAPKWCPFLENITEELEEQDTQIVYDDFKFVSYEELEQLESLHLLETRMVKQYMHGYLIHLKLYNKLVMDKGFNYENHKQDVIDKQMAQERESQRVEKGYIAKAKKQINNDNLKDVDKVKQDGRFTKLFDDDDFKIDRTSQHWKRLHPSERNLSNDGQITQPQIKKFSSKKIKKQKQK